MSSQRHAVRNPRGRRRPGRDGGRLRGGGSGQEGGRARQLAVARRPNLARRTSASRRNRAAQRWIQRLKKSGAQVFASATAFAAPTPRCLLAETPSGVLEITWQKLILATGARELFLPFPGWTLPGVLGPGGLHAMSKAGWPVAGKRVVVAGTGPLLLAVADGLKQHGARGVSGRRADPAGESHALWPRPLAPSGQARARPRREGASAGRAVSLRLLAGEGGGRRPRAARHAHRRHAHLDRGLRLPGLRLPSGAERRVAAAAGLRTGRWRGPRERVAGNDGGGRLLRRRTDRHRRRRLRAGRRPDCRTGRRGPGRSRRARSSASALRGIVSGTP